MWLTFTETRCKLDTEGFPSLSRPRVTMPWRYLNICCSRRKGGQWFKGLNGADEPVKRLLRTHCSGQPSPVGELGVKLPGPSPRLGAGVLMVSESVSEETHEVLQ